MVAAALWLRELRQFIEKQHAVVGEAHFTGPRHARFSAQQAGIRDGMVRRAKRTLAQQAGAFR